MLLHYRLSHDYCLNCSCIAHHFSCRHSLQSQTNFQRFNPHGWLVSLKVCGRHPEGPYQSRFVRCAAAATAAAPRRNQDAPYRDLRSRGSTPGATSRHRARGGRASSAPQPGAASSAPPSAHHGQRAAGPLGERRAGGAGKDPSAAGHLGGERRQGGAAGRAERQRRHRSVRCPQQGETHPGTACSPPGQPTGTGAAHADCCGGE